MPADDSQCIAPSTLPFVWITGQARSGTTVVTRAMEAHPQVLCNGRENNFLADLVAFVKTNVQHENRMRQCPVSPEDFAKAYRDATFDVMFPRSDLETATLPASRRQPYKVVAAFSSLKSELADFADAFFHQLHWVLVVRNGIEVVDSRMNHWNLADADFAHHCRAWADASDMVRWSQGRRNVTVIRHEWLLDPAHTTRCFDELQQRLALDPSDAPVDFIMKNLVSGRRRGKVQNAGRDDLATRTEAWRGWTLEQQTMFKEICGETARLLGYPIPF